MLDRLRAFEKVGIIEKGSVEDLVSVLVADRDVLRSQLRELKKDVSNILEKLYRI
jgi:hypothetical protein